MGEVFILLRRIYDPYGCLEDNEQEIIGVFTTEENANKNKELLKQKDKRKKFDYWIDNYKLNEIENFDFL